MKTRFLLSLGFSTFAVSALIGAGAGKSVQADIPEKSARQVVVDEAAALSHPVDLPPLPANLASPFTFDTPPPDVIASAGNPQASRSKDRETLDGIANWIGSQPRGIVTRGDTTFLFIGTATNRFQVGDKIPVIYEGKAYDVELAGIPNGTTYILKYNGEQSTRTTRQTGK